jgi:NADH-quinone oxidoreductase subunit E
VTPLMPKRQRPWQTDPGHIADVPEPPPMPDRQGESVGIPPPVAPPGTTGREAEEVPVDGEAKHRDPAPVPDPAEVEVPPALAQEIRRAMKRYPQKRSASIPALWAVQRRYGWCSPEGISQAAAVMGVTPGYLESVASFYDLFRLEPQGEHQVLVCTNISCWLNGADRLLEAFKQEAGAAGGEAEAPADDVFVRGFECLGACDIAPMVSINGRYYGPLTEDDAPTVIDQLRSKQAVLPERRLEDRPIAGEPRAKADQRITKHTVNKVKGKQG